MNGIGRQPGGILGVALSLLAAAGAGRCAEPAADGLWPALADGQFAWRASAPLLAYDMRATDTQVSIKDPTVVFHDGRWHLFCTVRFHPAKWTSSTRTSPTGPRLT